MEEIRILPHNLSGGSKENHEQISDDSRLWANVWTWATLSTATSGVRQTDTHTGRHTDRRNGIAWTSLRNVRGISRTNNFALGVDRGCIRPGTFVLTAVTYNTELGYTVTWQKIRTRLTRAENQSDNRRSQQQLIPDVTFSQFLPRREWLQNCNEKVQLDAQSQRKNFCFTLNPP